MKLPPTPPLNGGALRALVAAAESPATGSLIYALMSKQMGIADLLAIPVDDEPMPLDHRPRIVPRDVDGRSTLPQGSR